MPVAADSLDMVPPGVPQILINRESLDHNFDIELLGDCDIILAELFRRCGWSFTDPGLDHRFEALLGEGCRPGFVQPFYHLFPGAKRMVSSLEMPQSLVTSSLLSEHSPLDPASVEREPGKRSLLPKPSGVSPEQSDNETVSGLTCITDQHSSGLEYAVSSDEKRQG